MRGLKTLAIAVCGAFALSGLAFGTVIDFDDLTGSGIVPDGYGGVADWGLWTYYDSPQSPYNPHSGLTRVYNTGDGIFDFGTDVSFDGAWFAGYGSSSGFLPIFFELYAGGGLVHTSGQIDLLGDGVPTWLDAGYGGMIDTVRVVGSPGFFVMDDVTYTPTPGALALLGLGMFGLGRRRR